MENSNLHLCLGLLDKKEDMINSFFMILAFYVKPLPLGRIATSILVGAYDLFKKKNSFNELRYKFLNS